MFRCRHRDVPNSQDRDIITLRLYVPPQLRKLSQQPLYSLTRRERDQVQALDQLHKPDSDEHLELSIDGPDRLGVRNVWTIRSITFSGCEFFSPPRPSKSAPARKSPITRARQRNREAIRPAMTPATKPLPPPPSSPSSLPPKRSRKATQDRRSLSVSESLMQTIDTLGKILPSRRDEKGGTLRETVLHRTTQRYPCSENHSSQIHNHLQNIVTRQHDGSFDSMAPSSTATVMPSNSPSHNHEQRKSKPSSKDANTAKSHLVTDEVRRWHSLTRASRRAHRTSEDYLGVTGANPRTGLADVESTLEEETATETEGRGPERGQGMKSQPNDRHDDDVDHDKPRFGESGLRRNRKIHDCVRRWRELREGHSSTDTVVHQPLSSSLKRTKEELGFGLPSPLQQLPRGVRISETQAQAQAHRWVGREPNRQSRRDGSGNDTGRDRVVIFSRRQRRHRRSFQ